MEKEVLIKHKYTNIHAKITSNGKRGGSLMLAHSFKSDLDENEWNFIDNSLEQYGSKFGIKVNYHNYNFVCKENGEIIGVLKGRFGYDEGKLLSS